MTLGNDQRAGKGCANTQEIEEQFPWWLREKRRKAVFCCDEVTPLSSGLGQTSTSLQAKRNCNSFCTKPHLFVKRCTSLASQAKLQGTLQWWSGLQTMLSWVTAFIAWAGWVPHVGRGQRSYYALVSALACCCNQIWGRNVPALASWFLPFSMLILEHSVVCWLPGYTAWKRWKELVSMYSKADPYLFSTWRRWGVGMSKYPQSTWFTGDSMGQHFRNTKKNWLAVGKDANNFIV